jgi:hypothetical protein
MNVFGGTGTAKLGAAVLDPAFSPGNLGLPFKNDFVTGDKPGTKTAADAARLFNVHSATVSRLLARAGAGTMNVKAVV